ncbi:aspartic endopeptidase NDAI_0H02150 [Naumovozyma dairenensis CBS 421]|uniref:Uncharacterized protein n=1 Tax=Naumovozyma dairenensis (strain ATCC 10597 / BCRC 20456 / CBS 421 / NBRC 0211 / NRRL Y-12639) TaxID=1071378 RepID=G0WF28_NAUDC|nr:hypothetical protein NDAI_0H02150 [Naumovozyma dairenensis CBS 421]CCD26389.1 hypothetical protein NDAI_0H02150 [Naumovozyma dairenensis CBS 421]
MNNYSPYNNTFISKIFSKILERDDLHHNFNYNVTSTNETINSLQEVVSKMDTSRIQSLRDTLRNKEHIAVTNIDKFAKRFGNYLLGSLKTGKDSLSYNAGLFITFALATILLGVFTSIDSIPTTALPPTSDHPLFDVMDLDIHQECVIKRKNEKKDKQSKDYDRLDGFDEKYCILLPLSSGVLLCSIYYCIKKGLLDQSKLVQYGLKAFNFVLMVEVSMISYHLSKYLLHALMRNICQFKKLKPYSISNRYRLTMSNANEESDITSPATTKRYRLHGDSDKVVDVYASNQLWNLYFTWINTPMCSYFHWNVSTFLYYKNNWMFSNLIGMIMGVNGIRSLKMKNLRTSSYILIGLFFYDIYFVFFSKIMETVAMKIDIPVKLSLPINFDTVTEEVEFAILGLGDIILPGMFMLVCYKYDIWKWHLNHPDREFHFANWSYIGKYFITSFTGYITGIGLCLVALAKTGKAQPVLLYVVPTLLTSVLGLAWLQGDLEEMWTFRYDVIEVDERELQVANKSLHEQSYAEYIDELKDALEDDNDVDYIEEVSVLEYSDDDNAEALGFTIDEVDGF